MKSTNYITDPVLSAAQPHKYLGILGMVWLTFYLVSTFTALKTFTLGTFVFSVAAMAYPFVYIFADIFTEVYGYRVTRRVVWTGFACMILATSLASLYTFVPSPTFEHNDAYNLIFRAAPLVALAFLVANFAGELTNSYVVAKMKVWTKGKFEGARFVASTFLGQTVDNSIAFFSIFYFAGWFAREDIIPLTLTTVAFCTAWEIIALPITRYVIRHLKRAEGLDTYDVGTNFNPFGLRQ